MVLEISRDIRGKGPEVPQPDLGGILRAAGQHRSSIWADGDRHNHVPVLGQRREPCVVLDIPEHELAGPITGDKHTALGPERQRKDVLWMTPERGQRTISQIGQPDGGIVPAGGQPRAIGAEPDHANALAVVGAQDLPDLSGTDIPQPHGPVHGRRSEHAAIRSKRETGDAACVAHEGAFPSRVQVAEDNGVLIARKGEQVCDGAEGDRGDWAGAVGESLEPCAVCCIPHADNTCVVCRGQQRAVVAERHR